MLQKVQASDPKMCPQATQTQGKTNYLTKRGEMRRSRTSKHLLGPSFVCIIALRSTATR